MVLSAHIIHKLTLLGPEFLSIVFSPELLSRYLTYWTDLYHVGKTILPECFSLWSLYFHFYILMAFSSLFQPPSLPWYRTETGPVNAIVHVAKAQTHLKLYDSGSPGGYYRFDRDNNFFDYILIMKPLQL